MIESHLTSLEISRRLSELGIKKEALFYYWVACENPLIGSISEETAKNWFLSSIQQVKESKNGHDWEYPAYTASELLEMLPAEITGSDDEPFYITVEKNLEENWDVSYQNITPNGAPQWECHEDEKYIQNALAKMLIHLLENGIVKAEDL